MDWKVDKRHVQDIVNMLSLARASLDKCPPAVGIIERGYDDTRYANVYIRANGQDYNCEGDWARHALHLLQKIAVDNGVTEIPNHHGGQPHQIKRWMPS